MEAEMIQDNLQVPERPSLYDRLGGVYNIATVVDDLIDRVMTDPRLNANPRVDVAVPAMPAVVLRGRIVVLNHDRDGRRRKSQ
jgi:hypothetical protein